MVHPPSSLKFATTDSFLTTDETTLGVLVAQALIMLAAFVAMALLLGVAVFFLA